MRSLRYLHIRTPVNFRTCKTTQYDGRDYLVVPVVALMEGVVWPGNAEAPEFVPGDELRYASGGFNGRPVVMNHPKNADGQYVMANDPDTLEQYRWGWVFNAGMVDTKLVMEAWLDTEKAADVDQAARALERIEADEMVEVSVGVWVVTTEQTGEYDGEQYYAVWSDIIPDHLAILEEGQIGACSNEMGCGTPRVAMMHTLTNNRFSASPIEEPMAVAVAKQPQAPVDAKFTAAKEKWLAAHPPAWLTTLSLSDRDLRERLARALSESDSYFIGIEAVYPDDASVVYCSYGERGYTYYRQSYSLSSDGEVTLADDKAEQREVRTYEDVKTATTDPGNPPSSRAATAPTKCGCGRVATQEISMERKERVRALIAKKSNPFTDGHAAILEAMPEDQFKLLEDFQGETVTVEKVVEKVVEKPVAAPVASTVDEYVANAPEPIREVLQDGVRAAAARRAAATKLLTDSGRCEFTEAELKAMSLT